MTVIGDIDRQLLSQRHTRYAYLFGRARFALELVSDGITPVDPALYCASVLADLDAALAVEIDYPAWEE